MKFLDKFKSTDGRKYQMGTLNETVFSIDKNYSLVEVITLLKYQAYTRWGNQEALDIILTIGSIRECLLNDAKLEKINDRNALIKAMRNVDVNLGKVLRNFELLCETYSLPNPLGHLEGSDALQEMKKLVKLDKDFYGKEDAFVLTEEIYRNKSKELGADFLTDDEIYPLANIQIYDTMILLMLEVVQYDSKVLSNQIKELMFKLRRLVADRKALDLKMRNSNERISIAERDACDDLLLKMGEIKASFDGIAEESTLPNRLYYEINAREFWEKLANMFEVLNSVSPAMDKKNVKKDEVAEEEVEAEDVESNE